MLATPAQASRKAHDSMKGYTTATAAETRQGVLRIDADTKSVRSAHYWINLSVSVRLTANRSRIYVHRLELIYKTQSYSKVATIFAGKCKRQLRAR